MLDVFCIIPFKKKKYISYYAKNVSVYIFQLFIEAKKEEETLYWSKKYSLLKGRVENGLYKLYNFFI